MKIIIPELKNSVIREAISHFPDIEFFGAADLDAAAELVASGQADSMVSGLDYSSRDVLLTYKAHIPLSSAFFSSCFICKKANQHLIVADGGVNKNPSKEQLYTIIEDTAKTHLAYYGTTPKIALLSYSTYGSGGKNPDLEKYQFCLSEIKSAHPDWLIDGEMQLDAAISPEVAAKKTPSSPLKGSANILLTPDLNSGNILYKSLERFGGFTVAGPIIQGFATPLADLSRGSTVKDVILTINVIKMLLSHKGVL